MNRISANSAFDCRTKVPLLLKKLAEQRRSGKIPDLFVAVFVQLIAMSLYTGNIYVKA